MQRRELDFVLNRYHCLDEGTKAACIKIRDFLSNAEYSGKQIHTTYSCVDADEFVEAVKTLMAFAFQQGDTIPEKWQCDSDCRMVSSLLCPGECNICDTAEKKCPYFTDESLI